MGGECGQPAGRLEFGVFFWGGGGWVSLVKPLTLAHLGLSALLPPLLELVKGVHHGEDLHGADGVEHVGVVARGGAEPAAVVLAREDKVYGARAREGVGPAEEVQGHEAPVDAVEAEVLGQPVVVLVPAGVEGLDVLHMLGGGELQLVWEVA